MGIFGGSEPQLLTDGANWGKLREIIAESKEGLIIVSPYLDPTGDFVRQIVDARERGVEVALTFRRDKLTEYRKAEWFEKLASAGVKLGTVDRLHSKIYANERVTLVTSMNFHRSSGEESLEIGVLFDTKHRMSDPLDTYFDFLERHTEEVDPTLGKRPRSARKTARGTEAEHGFCIRCGTDIPLNTEKPYCASDYRKWDEWKDVNYVDKFCHRCGKPHPATMRKPVCGGCYSKAA